MESGYLHYILDNLTENEMAFISESPKFKCIKDAWSWWVSFTVNHINLGWQYSDSGEIYLKYFDTEKNSKLCLDI